MKTSKIPQQLAKNASKLHKHIGELLVKIYPNFDVRQEYSVSKVNPTFKSNREKYDWVVLRMNIVIEVHGEQHFMPVCFGGITGDEAKRNFIKRQEVDFQKEEAAKEAGWAYVIVKYDEKKITQEELSERIITALSSVRVVDKLPPKPRGSNIQNAGFAKDAPKQKIPSRPFQKREGKYKWPTRKINQ